MLALLAASLNSSLAPIEVTSSSPIDPTVLHCRASCPTFNPKDQMAEGGQSQSQWLLHCLLCWLSRHFEVLWLPRRVRGEETLHQGDRCEAMGQVALGCSTKFLPLTGSLVPSAPAVDSGSSWQEAAAAAGRLSSARLHDRWTPTHCAFLLRVVSSPPRATAP